MVERRFGRGDRAEQRGQRPRRGFVTVRLPRHVIPKPLKSGKTAFYYNVPTKYRKLKCPVKNEALGTDFAAMKSRADTLNGQFDGWDQQRKGMPVTNLLMPRYGTVDWLFREYKISDAYTKKVAIRSRDDYEWAMDEVCNTLTRKGDRVGDRLVATISPRAADRLYNKFIEGEKGERLRTGEKLVVLCRKAWRVVHRLFPDVFAKDIVNPWIGVTMKRRVKMQKAAVTRDEVYTFAHGCIEHGEIEAAAISVICFEWLQRPENVIAGHIKWNGYRNGKPTVRIEHHKTGAIVDHPLEDEDGTRFYEEAEEILEKLPKRGVPMVLREVGKGKAAKPFAFSTMQHIVQRMRVKLKLPGYFTFDACRHGGMTELEEAELTEGQGRALSAHRTSQAYAGYAKRTAKRMLSATRKRHAHKLAAEILSGDDLPEIIMPTNSPGGLGLGYIYFAKSGQYVKIGFTQNLPGRFMDFAVATPEPHVLVHYEVGTRDEEKAYHQRFAEHRVRGEWFKLSAEIAAFVREARQRTPVQNAQVAKFRMENGGDI
jgi:Meiotically up-regulated gene 113